MSEQITSAPTADAKAPGAKAFGRKEILIIGMGVLVIVVTALLGRWQIGRAHEKATLDAEMARSQAAVPLVVGAPGIDLAKDKWRRAVAVGEFDTGLTVYLQNRQDNDHTGFWVLTPLKLQGSARYVMVLRGWIPRNFQAMDLIAPYQTPKGLTRVDGLIAPPPTQWFSFFPDPPKAVIRQNIDLDQFARLHHIALLPYVLRQEGKLDDGLSRDWPAANTGISTNYGYAAQWFAMSAVAVLLLGYFIFRRLYPSARRRQR